MQQSIIHLHVLQVYARKQYVTTRTPAMIMISRDSSKQLNPKLLDHVTIKSKFIKESIQTTDEQVLILYRPFVEVVEAQVGERIQFVCDNNVIEFKPTPDLYTPMSINVPFELSRLYFEGERLIVLNSFDDKHMYIRYVDSRQLMTKPLQARSALKLAVGTRDRKSVV